MKFAHVKAIIAVADTGSIRRAAEQLGKTQSALTKQLQVLERELGFELFLRTSRGALPTEDGLSILARARSIYSEIKHLEEEASRLRGNSSGNVRISAAPLAATKILPRAIARFNTSFPTFDITISSDLFGDALKALREGQHDIILGPHGRPDVGEDIVIEELFSTEMVVITSASAAHAKATSLVDLAGCYWTMMGDTTGAPKARFQQHFDGHGVKPPQIRIASESRLGLLSLVRELDAVCTFPARLLDELGPGSGICRVPIRENLNPLTISMITKAGQSLTTAGSHFAECIRHRAGVLRREWD